MICVRPDFLLSLITEVGMTRALADHETDIIEDILAIEAAPFQWSHALEDELLHASTVPGGIARFARRHGIEGHWTCYMKLYRLRKRETRKNMLLAQG